PKARRSRRRCRSRSGSASCAPQWTRGAKMESHGSRAVRHRYGASMKRALIIRHVPVEGIAGFRQPIEEAGYVLDRIDVADPAFAELDLSAPDLLIMMGGPMSVYEQEEHPWLVPYLRGLARRLEADRPTLGVCLGAQLIAAALGSEVRKG